MPGCMLFGGEGSGKDFLRTLANDRVRLRACIISGRWTVGMDRGGYEGYLLNRLNQDMTITAIRVPTV